MVRRRLDCPRHLSMSLSMSHISSQEGTPVEQDDCVGDAQRGLLGQGGVALFGSIMPGDLDDTWLGDCSSLKSSEQEYDISPSASRHKWRIRREIPGQSTKSRAQLDMNQNDVGNCKINDPFIERSERSRWPSLATNYCNPTITLTPPAPASTVPLPILSSPLNITGITPTLTQRAVWFTKTTTLITTLCLESVIALRTYQTTHSPADLQTWTHTTEAFTSATSLDRLQQERRNMCLEPLGMKALRTHEAQDTFNSNHTVDKAESDEGRLLGFRMAFMERVCAVIKQSAGEARRTYPRDRSKEVKKDMSPRRIRRKEMVLYIEEATRRRKRKERTTNMHERTMSAEDASLVYEEIDEGEKEQKMGERKNLVNRIKEYTVRRQERRRMEGQV